MATKTSYILKTTALVLALWSTPIIWLGGQLTLSGGTPYYFCSGLLMLMSAAALWKNNPIGFHIFGATLLLTLGWAVYEVGNAFWLVGSRIWTVGLIFLWLCSPVITRKLYEDQNVKIRNNRMFQVCALASGLLFIAMLVDLVSGSGQYSPKQTVPVAMESPTEWRFYGADAAGTRYSPHKQINSNNVTNLIPVWHADTGKIGTFSGTPIQVEDALYLCTSQNVVLGLDADTGNELWRYDPNNTVPGNGIFGNCRGVTYFRLREIPSDQQCRERIYTATSDARLIALDKETGSPCKDFGDNGEISLVVGMGEVKPLFYWVTSPPTIARGILVVGGSVLDNQETEAPSGVVRGYDPRTGELVWAWDIGREEGRSNTGLGGEYTRGTPNVWSLMSADDELGLVYVPTGNATPDYFGGHRTELLDKYASSIVAIDAETGTTRWFYQTTHHDIWDYDVPSQPTLADITISGVVRKVVIVPTKRGELFVLDRKTGELITEVKEKAVPQTDLQHERTTATQPFSTGMPSFAHPYIGESDLFGIYPLDQIGCRMTYRSLRYEGPMTPPAVRGTLLYPGPAGGMNWGSVAVDPLNQLMVVNNLHLPWTIHMIPRDEDLENSAEGARWGDYGIGGPQRGTPFAARVQMFMSPFGIPCIKPPYGEIALVDLTTQEIVWRRGMGLMNLGFRYRAGSIVTAGRLIFNAGVSDGHLRAIDTYTGEVLWKGPLRADSGATPMSYVSSRTGKQYVLVTVPGYETIENGGRGGRVTAYALNEN